MAERIVERSSAEMYKEDQAKYAIVVDRRRALPEVRDGLKTVQRRILYTALKEGITRPSKLEKSQGLVGEIMKKYHPHGEAYPAVVTMATWFNNKIPLIYGHGNWGNINGSGAAAMRYTECALSEFGYEVMIQELEESPNIVDWMETYLRDPNIKEPIYLPAKVPILLLNGCNGIGVGMAINLPPHNLGEIIDATINLIHHPNANVTLIPDLCQACEIIDTDWEKISKTGNGTFKVRGKIETETDKKGNIILHIKSLPDGVSTRSVFDKILELKEKGQLPMLKDVHNFLVDKKPDITVQLKPGSDAEYFKQVLYTKTPVQKSMTVNFEAVAEDGINIRRYSYKDYLVSFINQRINVKFRLYCNKLQKAMTRYHYIDAFTKVLESGQIDKIIEMIKKSKDSDAEMIEKVIKMCKVTDIQAKFILEANLKKLSMGNLQRYREERGSLQQNITQWQDIVTGDGSYIINEIESELKEIKKKYNTPRLCTVISKNQGANIPKGTFKIVITEKNYIRKIPDTDKITIVRKDNPKFILRVDNAENILLFDNKGKVFNLPVHKIPITEKSSAGTDVRILVQNLTADIISVFYEPILKEIAKSNLKHHFVVLSKFNTIKRLDLEDFLSVNPSGLIYSKIRPEDEIVGVALAPSYLDLIVCSDKKALRYPVSDVSVVKRNAIGVKNMDTDEPIESLTVVYPETEWIVVLTKNGKFNKFTAAMLESHHRAQKGCQVIKLDSNDQIFGIYAVNESDHIQIVTSDGVETINVCDIKPKSKIAAGTRMGTSRGIILKADIVRHSS